MVLAFYQHADFYGERGAAVIRPALSSRCEIHFPPGPYRSRLTSYFKEVTFDRHGFMRGDYVLLENGLALLGRDGEIIRINSSADDVSASAIAAYYASTALKARIMDVLGRWDDLPLMEGLPCLGEAYSGNYYHFSLDLIPRIRFFDFSNSEMIALPNNCVSSRLQGSLLARAIGTKLVLPLNDAIRVRQPHLAHGIMSLDAIGWLRRTMNVKARSGSRRLYIHRSGSLTRTPPGGGIVQTPEFLSFLDRFGFETIDFGGGFHDISTQIAMLHDVGVILAAHGASLTNLTYLNPPLTVIEIFGPQTVFGGFLHIADSLGFDHHAMLCEQLDGNSDIIVDTGKLTALVSNL